MPSCETYLLGADIGTSSCKVALFDQSGRLYASSQERYPTTYPRSGWAEQDPEDWYRACALAIRRCLDKGAISPSLIAGLSVCGPAHSAVLLDRQYRPLRPVILWSDRRSVAQAAWLQEHFGSQVFDISFQPVNPSWTLAQLLWVRQNEPEVWQRLQHIMVCKDYVVWRLTGSWQTDNYDALGTQMYDARTMTWSSDLAGIVGLPVSCLPPLKDATAIAGRVTPEAAGATGLTSGTPVAVGSGDSVVEALGVGVVEPGQCIVKLATSGTVNIVTTQPRPCTDLMTYCHVVPSRWYTIAATNYAAAAAQWFAHAFTAVAGDSDGNSLVDELAGAVEPGSEGLLFHPYLQGERTPHWDPYLRGDFVGITVRHHAGHFARAVLEGVAYSLRDCLDLMRSSGLSITDCRILGGGAQSPLWRQIVADVLNLELQVPAGDATTYGAALLGGVASGIFSSVQEAARACLPSKEMVMPDARTGAIYAQQYALYRQVAQSLMPVYHILSELYMGKDTYL